MLGRKVGSKECPQENSFEVAWWLIFGTLFGYPLGQKSRRGTPEAQGLEHKVQGPEHMSQPSMQMYVRAHDETRKLILAA